MLFAAILFSLLFTFSAQAMSKDAAKTQQPAETLKNVIQNSTSDVNTQNFLINKFGKSTLTLEELRAEKKLQQMKNPSSPVMKVIAYLLAQEYDR